MIDFVMKPKIVVISQPRYLPASNYLHRMTLCDIFIYLDTVQFTERDYENRNQIKTPQGSTWITVPVQHQHHKQPLKEISIHQTSRWNKNHWGTLQRNYARAAHFADHASFLKDLYSRPWDKLVELNYAILEYLVQVLDIRCTFLKASELKPMHHNGQELLIDLVRQVGGTHYLSGALGRNYIQEDTFRASNLRLSYHEYVHPVYPQLWGNFLPYMSVIDLIFNCGNQSREILLKANPKSAFA
jgi:hypothetical protein